MKKISLFTILLVCLTASAQEPEEKLVIEKGQLSLSGAAALNFRSYEIGAMNDQREVNTTGVQIAPHLGYLVKDNLQIGLGLRYAHNKNENAFLSPTTNNIIYSTSNSIGATPYIRFYKGIGKQLSLYVQGEMGYDRIWTNTDDPIDSGNESKGYNMFLGIRPGITYFIGNKWALESSIGALGYSYYETEYEDGRSTKLDSFNLNLDASNIFLGLTYYF
ncbi:outer membrane beta-barrel protein [Maribacter flavus]|uniref:Porin family protein n=1 Tax=Maribacter flavus TaxID=1658664 RepID=A0A5B2TXE0_9FLAO|nr:outer membrane beta-barrel protein [Maribacter flavus]KAA2218833.1 porin family protein [Maribacter flavus]